MDSIIPTDEYTEVEGRYYANPQVALDRSRNFIDNLRATQAQQNEQIARDTYNLGSELPSVQGGLGTNTASNMGYFTSRYQTPQTASAVANLRATAQAAALNQALENEQAIWKKRYQDAYRAYQKRQNDKTSTPTTTEGGTTEGEVDYEDTALTGQGRLILDEEDLAEGGAYIVDPASGNIIGEGFKGDNPRYIRNEDGSYTKVNQTASANATPRILSTGGVLQNNAPLANALRSNL